MKWTNCPIKLKKNETDSAENFATLFPPYIFHEYISGMVPFVIALWLNRRRRFCVQVIESYETGFECLLPEDDVGTVVL